MYLTFRSGGDGRDLTPLPPRRAGEVRFLGKNGTVVTVVPVSEEQHKMVRLSVFLLDFLLKQVAAASHPPRPIMYMYLWTAA